MLIRLILLILCAWPTFASAQQEMRSAGKGASTPLPITGSVVDADHNALDVKCLSGCSGGGGSGDASLAEQQTQTGILTTIDADTGTISTNSSTLAGAVKAEDAAHTTGDTGVMALCVRAASPTDRSAGATDGDYEPCAVDASGRVHTSANLNTLAGTAIDANSGNKSAGTLRVVIATDQPQLTNKLLVTPDANSAVNVAQMNGVAVTMGAGATGTGTQRVNPVSSSATGAAPPAAASFIGGLGSGATGGFLTGVLVADSFVNVNVSTATTTLLITGVSGRRVRISSLSLVTAAANNVALISGTGATCGTGTTGMNGGTTAASGWNFAANGGITQGNGLGTINQTNATGDSVCIVTSAATQLSGRIAYAIY